MEMLITIIGTIVSVIGAIITVQQAVKAAKSADKAERIKSQIINLQNNTELSELQTRCKKAQNSMSKYGFGVAANTLRGVETKDDAQNVQEFLLLAIEYRTHFEQNGKNLADVLFDNVSINLQLFSDERKPAMQKELGSKILSEITNFTAVIKKVKDSKLQSLDEGLLASIEKNNNGNLLNLT